MSSQSGSSLPSANPFLKLLSSNPELMQTMILSNPRIKEVTEKNPQLRHALSDPKTLQDILQMSSNPKYYQEVMRGHDRAMSNLENVPEGFQFLRRMYESTEGAAGIDLGSAKGTGKSGIKDSTVSKELVDKPMPNPWNRRLDFPGIFAQEEDFEDRALKPTSEPILPVINQSPASSSDSGTFDLSIYEARFSEQLDTMHEMGFTDRKENIRALLGAGGNINSAIERLLQRL